MTRPPIPPVEKEIRLACSPAAAFRAFTHEIAAWWPVATHSLGAPDRVEKVVFECRQGGSIYELWRDGTRHGWGSVVEWNPPQRVAFTWHVGQPVELASLVTLSFTGDARGTAVRLVHSGWERLGDEARGSRDSYDSGWDRVLGQHFGGHFAETIRLKRVAPDGPEHEG